MNKLSCVHKIIVNSICEWGKVSTVILDEYRFSKHILKHTCGIMELRCLPGMAIDNLLQHLSLY